MNPLILPVLVGTLTVLAVLIVALVRADAGKRGATHGVATGLGKGVLLLVVVIGGLHYYHKDRDANKPSENSKKVERLFKRADGGADLSLEAFNRIHEGTSYSQVCNVLGKSGKLVSSTKLEGLPRTEMYEWSEGTEIVNCTFQDDKLVSKAQSGLW